MIIGKLKFSNLIQYKVINRGKKVFVILYFYKISFLIFFIIKVIFNFNFAFLN